MGRRPLFIYFFIFCNFPLGVFQNKNNKLSLSCLSASNSFLIFHGRVSWSLVDEFLSPQPSFLVTHGLLWKGKCLMTQEHLAHFPAFVQNISWFIYHCYLYLYIVILREPVAHIMIHCFIWFHFIHHSSNDFLLWTKAIFTNSKSVFKSSVMLAGRTLGV